LNLLADNIVNLASERRGVEQLGRLEPERPELMDTVDPLHRTGQNSFGRGHGDNNSVPCLVPRFSVRQDHQPANDRLLKRRNAMQVLHFQIPRMIALVPKPASVSSTIRASDTLPRTVPIAHRLHWSTRSKTYNAYVKLAHSALQRNFYQNLRVETHH
jgi:hypothetical protein